MTVEEGGEAAVVETTPQAAPEAAVLSQEPSSERNYEAEARAEGWVPEEEFSSSKRPATFLSAQEFVERGELFAPFRKRTEKAVDERVSKMERVFKQTVAALQAAHDKEIATLKVAKKEAIKEGNVEEVERIEGEISTLQENGIETKPEGKKAAPEPGSDDHKTLIRNFAKENTWYVEEPELAEYARWFSGQNADLNEGISFEDNMAATVAAVKKKFSTHFKTDKTAANGHAAVDGGGFAPGAVRTSGKGFSDLPGEAKRAYENFEPRIKKELSKEQYATEYFNG